MIWKCTELEGLNLSVSVLIQETDISLSRIATYSHIVIIDSALANKDLKVCSPHVREKLTELAPCLVSMRHKTSTG
jgi:hypothetical protein